MKSRVALSAWIVVMFTLVAMTAMRWRRPDVAAESSLTLPSIRDDASRRADTPLDSVASEIVAHDPFRLANAPPRTRYTMSTPAVALPVGRESRPTMTLKAIAGGPPWQALIEGVPGQTHAVLVQTGMVLDRLSIRAITRDGVIVRGPDTTWVLSFASRQ